MKKNSVQQLYWRQEEAAEWGTAVAKQYLTLGR